MMNFIVMNHIWYANPCYLTGFSWNQEQQHLTVCNICGDCDWEQNFFLLFNTPYQMYFHKRCHMNVQHLRYVNLSMYADEIIGVIPDDGFNNILLYFASKCTPRYVYLFQIFFSFFYISQ